MRKDLVEFANDMELVLRDHDAIKGETWRTCDGKYLYRRLFEEIGELGIARDDQERRRELIDIANLCMMLWHRLRPMPPEVECKCKVPAVKVILYHINGTEAYHSVCDKCGGLLTLRIERGQDSDEYISKGYCPVCGNINPNISHDDEGKQVGIDCDRCGFKDGDV